MDKNTQYIYDIGYNSYEESEYWQLCSQTKYSESELSELISDVFKIVNNMGGYKLDQEFKCEGAELYKDDERGYSVQTLYPSVIRYLIDFHNFSKLEYESKYSLFGWASVSVDDWGEAGGKLKLIRDKIKEQENDSD